MSPFDKSDLISIDGAGDWTCTMMAIGDGNNIKPIKRIFFPNSLGIFYTAMTQFLGFPHYGDEYKVMGLAPYGKPRFIKQMREILKSKTNGLYELNLKYFSHQERKKSGSWKGGIPTIDVLYSSKLKEILGEVRSSEDALEQVHKDIAASIQLRYEEVVLDMLTYLHKKTGNDSICISGGCAMNSVANGKILTSSAYKNVFIPPQPGDAGGALGAAVYTYVKESGPMTLWEAMSMQCCVVSTDVGDAKDYVKTGSSGEVVDVNDYNEMAEKVVSLLENLEKKVMCSKRARNIAIEKLDISVCANKHLKVYQQLSV